jgi:hypothetical protein
MNIDNKTLRMLGAVLGAIGLAGCSAEAPPETGVSESAESESIVSGGTLAEALRDADAYARARRLGALLPTLGPAAIPEVREALEDYSLDMGAVEFELLVRFWASREPAAATNWVLERGNPDYKAAAMRVAMQLWAAVDPEAALVASQAMRGLTGPEVIRAAQVALVRGWFESDHAGLEQYIRDLGRSIQRQRALFAYALAMLRKQGSEALMRWAESVPEANAAYKLSVYGQVTSALGALDRDAALRWCDAHCDGPLGSGLRLRITRQWLHDEGGGVPPLEWLSRAAEGEDKEHALRVTFSSWGLTDRQAALAWMAAQTAGEPAPWVRSLFAHYAKLLAEDSPAEAIEWAERVEDDREREAALILVASMWRQQDEAASEAWLLQSSLSEEAREKARKPVAAPPRGR